MIVIQYILIASLTFMLIKFLSAPGSMRVKAWKKIIGIVFVFIAIFAVLFPSFTNTVAKFVGVGRGADLLLYLLTLAFIFVTFNIYLNSKIDRKRADKVIRKLAIIEALTVNKWR